MVLFRRRLLVVGDSVILFAGSRLRALRGWSVRVDARECRQVNRRVDGCGATDIPSGVDAVRDGVAARRPHAIVMHLGHNGRVTAEDFDQLMEATPAASRVIWLTLCLPERWADANNGVIVAGVDRWDRARLIDWRACSVGTDWIRDDLIHLTHSGADALTALVADALR